MGYEKVLKQSHLLKQSIEEYESGDLMQIAEIQESLNQLIFLLEKTDGLKKLAQFIQILLDFSLFLSKDQYEERVKGLFLLSSEILILLFSYKKEPKEAAQEINKIIKDIKKLKKEEEKSLNTKTASFSYPKDYFDSIVQDSKMLSQMVEEMRNLLDMAQYTLVELEHDDTHVENINKVFRSFHTIKGSSSFLGLKNIEEVSHEMESLLVLVRDKKLRISKDLIDVIFFGIELLRTLASAMEINQYDTVKIIASFKNIEIFYYVSLVKKILSEYEFRKIGEILEEEGKLNPYEVKEILKQQNQTQKKFGEIAVEEKMVTEADITDAVKKQILSAKKTSYVRVSNQRLNSLIDMVGELVINQSMLKEVIYDTEESSSRRERIISQLETITTDIKNLVLSMGMVPIAEIFNKLRVVVRNTAKDLNKGVVLEIKGEDTELDRNVMESIYDPLVHIVRNAIDHGLESPDKREENQKDRVGKVQVFAEHKGDGIEILVSDDGQGINKNKVLEKALKLELTTPEEAEKLTEKEIYNFLLMPGFSTASKVTEVSGRGVGLDVVKKNIDEINGRIEILSKQGEYTRFIIKLPLTLAIIEGFVTEVGENRYVFPFNTVEEVIVPKKEQINQTEDGSMMFFHREQHIPIVFSGEIFKEVKCQKDLDKLVVLIISYDGKQYGIVVDRVIGKQETVIKNLSEMFAKVHFFSGGTIFGNGDIGFVVDMEGFLEEIKKNKK